MAPDERLMQQRGTPSQDMVAKRFGLRWREPPEGSHYGTNHPRSNASAPALIGSSSQFTASAPHPDRPCPAEKCPHARLDFELAARLPDPWAVDQRSTLDHHSGRQHPSI